MSATVTALLVFACVFGGALLGMMLRAMLPAHHLSSDTKDTVKLSMGLVATMAALILGLLVASAKSTYDAESNGITQMAAKIVFLDRMLANYGPETKNAREVFRRSVQRMADGIWPEKASDKPQLDPTASRADALFAAIQDLSPQNNLQTALKSQISATSLDLGQMRWLEFGQSSATISNTLLYVLTFWLAVLFVSFGLFAPSNGTVVAALLLAAFSVSGAIYLILELETPFTGLMQISNAPFVSALAHLGQ